MARWEYATICLSEDGVLSRKLNEKEAVAKLNAMGRDGWELVSADSPTDSGRHVLFFKRPVEE